MTETESKRDIHFLRTSLLTTLAIAWILLATEQQTSAQPPAKKSINLPTGMKLKMPGESFQGKLPVLTKEQQAARDRLARDLKILAGDIGERNLDTPVGYQKAIKFLEGELTKAGYKVGRQTFQVKGRDCVNIEAELLGKQIPKEILVLGAHYDSVEGTAGANDNGTGTVALLELARAFAGKPQSRTVRFVFFANEEPPYFQTEQMGSLVYARRCKARKDDIVGMMSLETMGYYSDEKDSQKYPMPMSLFYPSTANFIAFVANTESRGLVENTVSSFRKHAKFPSEGCAIPAVIEGAGWSDHWSFWQVGYPALMVTDTAPFRYPHYHLVTDTPDKVNYGHLARVVTGLEKVIIDLTNPPVFKRGVPRPNGWKKEDNPKTLFKKKSGG